MKRKYRVNQATRLKEKDVRAMFDLANTTESKALISCLWLTGCRPQEARMIVKKDFEQTKTGYVVSIHTLKLGDDGSYFPQERRLPFATPDPNSSMFVYLKCLINYVISLPDDDCVLFDMTTRTIGRIVERLSLRVLNQPYAPYHFRHSCFSWMAADPSEGGLGYNAWQLKAFKGSKTLQSVEAYVHTSVKEVDLGTQQRGAGSELKPIGLAVITETPAPQPEPTNQQPKTVPQTIAISPEPAPALIAKPPVLAPKPEPPKEPTTAELIEPEANPSTNQS